MELLRSSINLIEYLHRAVPSSLKSMLRLYLPEDPNFTPFHLFVGQSQVSLIVTFDMVQVRDNLLVSLITLPPSKPALDDGDDSYDSDSTMLGDYELELGDEELEGLLVRPTPTLETDHS